MSAEKLGVTGSNGVNVIHEAHGAVSGWDSFGARPESIRVDVVTTRNPARSCVRNLAGEARFCRRYSLVCPDGVRNDRHAA